MNSRNAEFAPSFRIGGNVFEGVGQAIIKNNKIKNISDSKGKKDNLFGSFGSRRSTTISSQHKMSSSGQISLKTKLSPKVHNLKLEENKH